MRAHTLFACSLMFLGCDVETQKSVQYLSPGDDTGEQSEPVDVDSDDTGGDDTGEPGPADGDGDGVADDVDNCPDDANADQLDADGDGESEGGDACDACTDLDGDGYGSGWEVETCPPDSCPDSNDSVDADDDGIPDGCDDIHAVKLAPVPEGGPKVSSLSRPDSEPNRVYGISSTGKMFQTSNGGEYWDVLALPDDWEGEAPYTLTVSPGDGDVLFLGTEDGQMYRSNDGGLSWIAAGMPEDWVAGVEGTAPLQTIARDDRVFVRRHSSVLLSVDDGLTYEETASLGLEVEVGLEEEEGYTGDMSIDALDSDRLWIVSRTGDPFSGLVHESTDGGETWTAHSAPEGECMSIAVHPDETGVIWCAKAKVFRSDDGGASWDEFSELPAPGYPDVLVVDPSNANRLYMALRSYGPALSEDGGYTWTMIDDPLIDTAAKRTYAISVNSDDSLDVLLGGNTGHQRSTDGAVSFEVANEGVGDLGYVGQIEVSPFDSDVFLIQGSRSVFWSEDAGASWTQSSDVPPCVEWMTSQLTPDKHNEGQWYYACGINGLFKSTNNGRSFALMDEAVETSGDDQGVDAVYVHPTVPNRLFIVLDGALNQSDDGGNTWEPTSLGLDWMTSFLIHPTLPSTMYVGAGRGVVRYSLDSGETWSDAAFTDADGEGVYARQISADPDDTSVAWAINGEGLYRTETSGSSWEQVYAFGWLELSYKAPVLFTDDGRIIMPSVSGVHLSADSGASWVGFDVVTRPTDFALLGDDLLVTSEDSGIWRVSL